MSEEVRSEVDRLERSATITTTFDQPVDVVWTLWSDPAKLARWWGPPGIPMTVDHHDLSPGGSVEVTAHTAGSAIRGHWSIAAVEPPRALHFTFVSDGLAPTEVDVQIAPSSDAATTMTITTRFASDADLSRAIEIGFVDGVARACGSAHATL